MYLAVFKDEFAGTGAAYAEFVELGSRSEPFHALLDDEGSDPVLWLGVLGVGLGIHNLDQMLNLDPCQTKH